VRQSGDAGRCQRDFSTQSAWRVDELPITPGKKVLRADQGARRCAAAGGGADGGFAATSAAIDSPEALGEGAAARPYLSRRRGHIATAAYSGACAGQARCCSKAPPGVGKTEAAKADRRNPWPPG